MGATGSAMPALAFAAMLAGLASANTLPPLIRVTALPGGSVQIDGEAFSDPAKLRTKLDTLRKKIGTDDVDLDSPGCSGDNFKRAVRLLRSAGAGTIGCLVPPRPVP